MTRPQLRRTTGKNCRSAPAAFAAGRRVPASGLPANYAERRIPLFAQFPPVALFAAIGRATSRRTARQRIASGTGLAISRLRHSSGGP
jgi:hypothetical protein